MNELTRYEHEAAKQLSDLPVPDENMAWGEMAKMLDEKKDDGPVVPFWLAGGCMWWGLGLLLLSLTTGWYFFAYKKKNMIAEKEKISRQITPKAEKNKQENNRVSVAVSDTTLMPGSNIRSGDTIAIVITIPDEKKAAKMSNIKKSTARSNVIMKNGTATTDDTYIPPHIKNRQENSFAKNKKPAIQKGRQKIKVTTPLTEETEKDVKNETDEHKKDPLVTAVTIANTDTSLNQIKNEDKKIPVKITSSDTSATAKKQDKPSKKYFFSTGVAVFQPFAINGESAVPFNRNGRKGSLTDYIPSVYIRLHRDKKWFIQSEFRFGVPQSSRSFIYRKEKIDTVTTASYLLKKTFYHQVPLSFNYYILPGLSVGTGIIYSQFSTAISQQDIMRNLAGTDTLLSSNVVRDKVDSNFTKRNFQWLAEVQYQWKRFSFGARYSQDLRPFIHYTDQVSGLPVRKKNAAFNIFLRYELWKLGKK